MTSLLQFNLLQHQALMTQLLALEADVTTAANMVSDCLRDGGKLLLCGNGGSAADSQHIAAELIGRFSVDRRPLAAMALLWQARTLDFSLFKY